MEEKKVYVIIEGVCSPFGNNIVGVTDNLETAKEYATRKIKEYCERHVRWELEGYHTDIETRTYYVKEFFREYVDEGRMIWSITSDNMFKAMKGASKIAEDLRSLNY